MKYQNDIAAVSGPRRGVRLDCLVPCPQRSGGQQAVAAYRRIPSRSEAEGGNVAITSGQEISILQMLNNP
jgi:hypothetical protein